MRLNEGLFEDSALYEIKGYYDSNFRGLEASDVAYDLDDAFEIAWEYLSNGDYVEIVDTDTGKRIVWEPDMLDEFDGEFPYDNMAKLMQKSVERNVGESMRPKKNRRLVEAPAGDFSYFKSNGNDEMSYNKDALRYAKSLLKRHYLDKIHSSSMDDFSKNIGILNDAVKFVEEEFGQDIKSSGSIPKYKELNQEGPVNTICNGYLDLCNDIEKSFNDCYYIWFDNCKDGDDKYTQTPPGLDYIAIFSIFDESCIFKIRTTPEGIEEYTRFINLPDSVNCKNTYKLAENIVSLIPELKFQFFTFSERKLDEISIRLNKGLDRSLFTFIPLEELREKIKKTMVLKESYKSRRTVNESLPKGKKGKFLSDMYNAVSDVILKYEANSWEESNTGDFEPSKKDIEFALEVTKRKLFAADNYEESFTNKPRKQRRTVNESLRKSGKKLNKSMNEDFEDFNIGDKFKLDFPEGDSSEVTILNVYKNGKVKFKEEHPDFGTHNGLSNSDVLKKWLNHNNYKKVNGKAMDEDLEPEAIDEPEKAEITWVDDSGEQKVSTVELVNKSFPETALKFSKERDDCSIINCTAPLKGAQKEDEPEKVALTESEETDGLANLISNEINGEFETTNGYRNLRQVASEIAPDMLPVIDDIMDEENTHVGQLQTLLSMVDDSADNIDVGAEEAEDQLEDEDAEIEHNDEVDVDFADIKKSDDEDADLEVKDDFDFDDEPFDEE